MVLYSTPKILPQFRTENYFRHFHSTDPHLSLTQNTSYGICSYIWINEELLKYINMKIVSEEPRIPTRGTDIKMTPR